MYRIIWNDNVVSGFGTPVTQEGYVGYRNSPPNPADQRPTSVDADRYEVTGMTENIYMPQVTFFKEDRQMMTLFQLPLAIEDVAVFPQ